MPQRWAESFKHRGNDGAVCVQPQVSRKVAGRAKPKAGRAHGHAFVWTWSKVVVFNRTKSAIANLFFFAEVDVVFKQHSFAESHSVSHCTRMILPFTMPTS